MLSSIFKEHILAAAKKMKVIHFYGIKSIHIGYLC